MKKLLGLSLASLLLAGTASASPITIPPAQYDHPFHGYLRVISLSYWDVNARCGGAQLGARYAACTRPSPDGSYCLMILPQLGTGGVDEDELVALIRHETAHCSGWPADHPGGRF